MRCGWPLWAHSNRRTAPARQRPKKAAGTATRPCKSLFYEGAQPGQGGVPLIRNHVQVTARFFEARAVEFPDALAAPARRVHEPRPFHHAKMLRNRLAGDARSGAEARDGHGTFAAEPADEMKARLIAKGGEDRS